MSRDRLSVPMRIATATAVAIGLVSAVWVAAGESAVEGPLERTAAESRAFSEVAGCLLTGPGGVSRAPASEVWAGMQAAAEAAQARVSFLPLSPGGSPAAQLNALAAGGCDVIVAVGPGLGAAVDAAASTGGSTKFAVAGATGAGTAVLGFPATRVGARDAVTGLLAGVDS